MLLPVLVLLLLILLLLVLGYIILLPPSTYEADPAAAHLAAFASLQSVFTYHLAPASHSS